MADITRTGTDLLGVSEPGLAVRPANDYFGHNITLAVDVQQGQLLAINSSGKGILADASAGQNNRIFGMSTEKKKAGQRVHAARWGLMAGFTFPGGAIGDPVYLSNTAGEFSTTAGDVPVIVGWRNSDGEIFLDMGMGVGGFGAGLAAAVAALTDSSGGAVADGTIAANAAQFVVTIPITLAQLANGDVLTNYVPGFKGTILKASVAVKVPATTAAKLATLNLEIGTTDVTGGVIALTSANMTPLGNVVNGSAITAGNVFSATDSISVEASAVTAFVEGEAYLLLVLASDLQDDNNADFAAKINAMRTALINATLMAA